MKRYFVSLIIFLFVFCGYVSAADDLFGELRDLSDIEYTIISGDTLGKIAKKYNTTIELLQKVNYISGSKIYVGRKLKVPKGKFKVYIDKSDNTLRLFFNDKLLKEYTVATGRNNKTPVGEFKIVNKLINPTWYNDNGDVIPPGDPKNELGTRWLGFDLDSYGIHGTITPDSLGRQTTSGCIRMLNSDVEELFALVPVGTVVVIKD